MEQTIKPIETIYNGYRFRSRLEARWAVFFNALGVEFEYEPEGFVLPSGKYYLPDFRVKCYGKRGSTLFPGEMVDTVLFPCLKCTHHVGFEYDMASWFNEFCEFCNPEKDWDNPPQWVYMRRAPERTEIVKCDRCNPVYPFDLYIEVKGKMTQDDADKIHEFSHKCGASVLVVGNIPDPDDYIADNENLKSYERMDGIDIYSWNYETIDGDYFAAYPAVANGYFYLDGDDSNYQTADIDQIKSAFRKARQARFEHGERP